MAHWSDFIIDYFNNGPVSASEVGNRGLSNTWFTNISFFQYWSKKFTPVNSDFWFPNFSLVETLHATPSPPCGFGNDLILHHILHALQNMRIPFNFGVLYHLRISTDYFLLIKNPFVLSYYGDFEHFQSFFSISPGDHCGSRYVLLAKLWIGNSPLHRIVGSLVLYRNPFGTTICVIVA